MNLAYLNSNDFSFFSGAQEQLDMLIEQTVRRLAISNKLPAAKIGRKWEFIKQDLAHHVRNQYSYGKSVVQIVGTIGDESFCQYTDETLPGGLNSLHQMEKRIRRSTETEDRQQA